MGYTLEAATTWTGFFGWPGDALEYSLLRPTQPSLEAQPSRVPAKVVTDSPCLGLNAGQYLQRFPFLVFAPISSLHLLRMCLQDRVDMSVPPCPKMQEQLLPELTRLSCSDPGQFSAYTE